MAELSLEPLQKVLARLREGLEAYEREPGNTIYLDSVIKRFELAYEMSRNTLARFLEQTSFKLRSDEGATLATLIRTANQDGLLRGTWEQWREFRDARNQTSHAYDEGRARMVASHIPLFLEEAEYLYEQMRRKLAKD